MLAADVPGAIDIEFVNADVDLASVVSGQSVNVTRTNQAGTVALQMRVQKSPRKANTVSLSTDFVPGDYTVEIWGDPPSPVMSLPDGARPAHALDGAPGGWPTGDHVSGGNCVVHFSVK